MFLNIPLIADWYAITQKREHLINKNQMRENSKQKHLQLYNKSEGAKEKT
jgi:hypothetical protein